MPLKTYIIRINESKDQLHISDITDRQISTLYNISPDSGSTEVCVVQAYSKLDALKIRNNYYTKLMSA